MKNFFKHFFPHRLNTSTLIKLLVIIAMLMSLRVSSVDAKSAAQLSWNRDLYEWIVDNNYAIDDANYTLNDYINGQDFRERIYIETPLAEPKEFTSPPTGENCTYQTQRSGYGAGFGYGYGNQSEGYGYFLGADPQGYKTGFRWAIGKLQPTLQATWSLTVPYDGHYEIWALLPKQIDPQCFGIYNDHSLGVVTYNVSFEGGDFPVRNVSQAHGDQQLISKQVLNRGETISVSLNNQGIPNANTVVIFDAIKLVFLDDNADHQPSRSASDIPAIPAVQLMPGPIGNFGTVAFYYENSNGASDGHLQNVLQQTQSPDQSWDVVNYNGGDNYVPQSFNTFYVSSDKLNFPCYRVAGPNGDGNPICLRDQPNALGNTYFNSRPPNLHIQSVDNENGIELLWEYNSLNRFVIERDDTVLVDLPAYTHTYLDTDITGNKRYCYTVYAYNQAGTSQKSDQQCLTTSAGSPTGGNYNTTEKKVAVSQSSWATSYKFNIWSLLDSTRFSKTVPTNSLSVGGTNINPPLKSGVKYFWNVVAKNDTTSSDESDIWDFIYTPYPYDLVSISTVPDVLPVKNLPALFDNRFYPEYAIINYGSSGPVSIIFEFLKSTELTGFRMSLGGDPNRFDAYSVKIESAANLVDLNAGTGSRRLIVSNAPARGGLNTISFPVGEPAAKFFKVTVDRNDGDQMVHVDEMIPLLDGNQPEGGSLTGKVLFGSGGPVNGAIIQACAVGGSCAVTSTNSSGRYTVSNLLAADYTVTAFSPAGTNLLKDSAGPVSLTEGQTRQVEDLILVAPVPPPPTVNFNNTNVGTGSMPRVYWKDQLPLTIQACAGGSVNYSVNHNGNLIRSGAMIEVTPGVYSAQIPALFPYSGSAKVSIQIVCPDGADQTVGFNIYIDPSGWVRDVSGAPIIGATVVLYRSDVSGGPFEVVPDGSAIMSPMNRQNPDLTDGEGHFGWDVIAGYYKVRASKAGCVSPIDLSQAYVETAVLEIPPAVFDLDLRLNCNPPTSTPTKTATPTRTPTRTLTPTYTRTVTPTRTPTLTLTHTLTPTQTFTITPTSTPTQLACGIDAPYVLDEHTLLLLHFDDNYLGEAGESGNASGTTFTNSGKYVQGISIDESDSLIYPSSGNFSQYNGAIEFWIRPHWNGDDGNTYTFFEIGQDWPNRMRIFKDGANNLRFLLWDDNGWEYQAMRSITDWQSGVWRHIAVTWRGSEITLYIDGEQLDRSMDANLPATLGSNLYIGSTSGGYDQANADIDELRISDIPRFGSSDQCAFVPVDTPTPTKTLTPTETETPTQTLTPTETETSTPTETETLTPTNTPALTNTRTPRPSKTPTPTKTVKPIKTATVTRTSTLTSTPTNTPTLRTYPATIPGLQTLLKDLAQQGLVDDEAYKALKAVLVVANEFLQSGHKEAALSLLRIFRQVVDSPRNQHVTDGAAQQLVDLTQKVINVNNV